MCVQNKFDFSSTTSMKEDSIHGETTTDLPSYILCRDNDQDSSFSSFFYSLLLSSLDLFPEGRDSTHFVFEVEKETPLISLYSLWLCK